MSTATTAYASPDRAAGTRESTWVRCALISIAMAFIFAQAFAKGIGIYLAAIVDDDALAAMRLTLIASGIAVPLNLVFGASGWQTFWRVTLPNIKWGLLYGVILCNARAMGEFG